MQYRLKYLLKDKRFFIHRYTLNRLSTVNRKAARIARLPATPADLVSGNDIHCIAATSAVERQQLYYLRNRCSHGFVSVDERRKVIVQETGLDSEHPAGSSFFY